MHTQQFPIYLDYQATTPLDPRVQETLAAFHQGREFGNPHSMDHIYGWRAADAVKEARSQVAQFIQADMDEIIFTSGATESCNIALRGAAKAAEKRNEIVTLSTEHPAVLETVRALQEDGFVVHIVPVGQDGVVDLAQLNDVMTDRVLIVSAMLANNEIGVLQPVAKIADIAHRYGALMHTDATQAAGRIPIDVNNNGVDLLTLSGHKVYGPKGAGCLYIRNTVRDKLAPIITGGGQERGLRPGTVPVSIVAGFGKACEIAYEETASDSHRIQNLSLMLWDALLEMFPSIRLYGHPLCRISGNLNFAIPHFSGEEIIARMQDTVAISTGSACSSTGTQPSHVIIGLGFSPEEALQAVRISLGRFTTAEEIDRTIQAFHANLGIGVNVSSSIAMKSAHA